MSQRVTLVLSDEAVGVIEANATERKRGEFVSSLLVDYARTTGDANEADSDDGILERIDSRLTRLEKQMAILIKRLKG